MSSDNLDNNVIPMPNRIPVAPSPQADMTEGTAAANAVCPLCFGTGTRLVPDKQGGLTTADICNCRRSNKGARLLAAAHIPPRYEHCTFDTYEVSEGSSLWWARDTARRRVKDFSPGKGASVTDAPQKGLVLVGSVGVGKTHLAVAMIKALIEKAVPCLFCEFGSLLKQIQDSYNPLSNSSEMRVLAPIYETEVLVLDELGATVPTDWVRDTMYQIINKRYNDKLFTIFTTNYFDYPKVEDDPQPTPNKRTFSQKNSAERIRAMTTLEERIGIRLRTRLYEMCDTLTIVGEDFRPSRG